MSASVEVPIEGQRSGSPGEGGSPEKPPVLTRLLQGSFWLALRTPIQAALALWTTRLILNQLGEATNAAFNFAFSFGFLQYLLELGMSSALARRISQAWTCDDGDELDRAVSCGVIFYSIVSMAQAAILVGIAEIGLPASELEGEAYRLSRQILWLQALTAPFCGISTIVVTLLQAARRYGLIPAFEVLIVLGRFAILWGGIEAGWDFIWILAFQLSCQIGLSLIPGVWVLFRRVGYRLRLRRVDRSDFASLFQFSLYYSLIQLSVALATGVDQTVIGFLIADQTDHALTVYTLVSKPFFYVRQTGWILAHLVMPAAASLVAAQDRRSLDRLIYDVARLHIGLLVPIVALAGLYARPFLLSWMYPNTVYGEDAVLIQIFLLATLPLALSVHVQVSIGMGRIAPIAWAAIGSSLVNLPVSIALTYVLGMPGVIWGTVITSLTGNFLIPGAYLFRTLEMTWSSFLNRTLSAPLCGLIGLTLASGLTRFVLSPDPSPAFDAPLLAAWPLLTHLSFGVIAYTAGYLIAPAGRADLQILLRRMGRRDPDVHAENAHGTESVDPPPAPPQN